MDRLAGVGGSAGKFQFPNVNKKRFAVGVPNISLAAHLHHGGGASEADEVEYDRLRALARGRARLRTDCFTRSREAYANGHGAAARDLSEAGKRHRASMERYNAQARDYIFRANNVHLPSDTIDLHRLHVEEAIEILEKRIDAARGRGEGYLNVIVGKGNHSAGGVRKVGPAVMELCRQRGLEVGEEAGNWGKLIVVLGEGRGGEQGCGRYAQYYPEAPGFLYRWLIWQQSISARMFLL
ncbi:unnamed protein product [Tuber aestivum]|uniref:Smr domain-containing protein n=1 Tax=Tuber aestivum TaxID=59557 RepID=A0A292Q2Y6_9PEZI|nr:unnamed protein product [Tuber aestivum]